MRRCPPGADGYRSLDGNGCRQISSRHRAHGPWSGRHRRFYQGRPRNLPADPDIHIEVDRAQDRPSPLPAAGLIITGQAILTPMLMVPAMITGDFLAMASSTDNVRPSPSPSVWKIGKLTMVGICMGLLDLLFGVGSLIIGKVLLHLNIDALRTLTVVTPVFSGRAVLYVVRERRHLWSSPAGQMADDVVHGRLGDRKHSGNGRHTHGASAAIHRRRRLWCGSVVLALVMDVAKIALFRFFEVARPSMEFPHQVAKAPRSWAWADIAFLMRGTCF